MNNTLRKIREFVKDIKYFLDTEKVDTNSLPGLPPVSPERADEISKEASKNNLQGTPCSPRMRCKRK